MEENMLEISGLRVHFDTLDGPIEALHSVDLSVKKGEIMGLVGESGCGKSVTSLVTIGLATCKIDSGSIRYDGKELLHKIPHGTSIPESVREIRWMLEELRVSYFAQQLGTPYPISDKRIQMAIDAC